MLRRFPDVQIRDTGVAIDSVVPPSSDTLATAFQNQGGLPWDTLLGFGVELLIALGAIITAIYAIVSYNKNRFARRALAMLYHEMGYIGIPGQKQNSSFNIGICVRLKNFGINPAYNLKASLLLFNNNGNGIAKIIVYNHNPITEKTIWSIRLLKKELLAFGINGSVLQQVNYLILMIEYKDIVIKNIFSGKYYTAVGKDGDLVDPNASDIRLMKKSEKTETWPILAEL